MDLISPSVTKSSVVESKVSLDEENVHQIFQSSTNPLEDVSEDNVPVGSSDVSPEMEDMNLICPSVTKSLKVESNASLAEENAVLDEVRTTISVETSGNIETTELKEGELITKYISRKFPLDTIPMEFIYPCLPYFPY